MIKQDSERAGKKMSQDVWDIDFDISKSIMNRRVLNCTHFLGWQHAVRLMLDRGKPLHNLKIAEVGCGTGTTSLTFGLLGASVTLLDSNPRVLKKAQDIYNLYDCEAELIHADCTDTPMVKLKGKFDFVISSGLAEHFIGVDREQCIRYHRLLLNNGGIAYIGVPNNLSPFYQWVTTFRKLTGTWKLEVEIPFTRKELKELAIKVGFKGAYVIGNAPLTKDLIDYSRGFVSAIKELFPSPIQDKLPSLKVRADLNTNDIRRHCLDMVEAISRGDLERPRSPLTNAFSAGLILFAFN